MNKYNLVIVENKQCIPFLNLTEKEFYDKLWEWTYEDDLWDYIEECNPTDEELENFLDQFIRENVFHNYEDDDVNCFALDYVEQEIKDLCKFFGARAYINLAPKSIKKTTMLQIKYLVERAYIGDFKKIWKSWNTCAGEIKGEEPRWIIDIDAKTYDEIFYISKISKEISDFIEKCEPNVEPLFKVITEIPTNTGCHLITTPFNLQQFKEKYPDIDVHKNNPTFLYCL